MDSLENSIEQNEQPKKVLCIGGFLSGAKFPWGTQIYTSFDSIKADPNIESKEYLLNQKVLTPLEMLSIPWLYDKTRKETASLTKLSELRELLWNFNPCTVVAHSLGCELINNLHLQGFSMPPSVTEIRFYQADEVNISNPVVSNYHSPYDPVLWVANLANMRSRNAGMFGDPNHTKNIELHPNVLRRHAGIIIVDAHLDAINSVKI
jgi:hypothetical protein